MSDDYKKDKLEDLFKGSFDDLPETPAENGWDLPSDGVWNRVDANLRPRRRRRGGLIWWLFGLGLLMIVGWAIYWLSQERYSDFREGNPTLEIVESTDTKASDNDSNEEETNSQVYSEDKEYLKENQEITNDLEVTEFSSESESNVETPPTLSVEPQVKTEGTGISSLNQATVAAASEQRERPVNTKNSTSDIRSVEKSNDPENDEQLNSLLKDQVVESNPLEQNQKSKEDRIELATDTLGLKRRIAQRNLLQQLPLKMQVLTYESEEKLPKLTYEANDFITSVLPKTAGLYVGVEASVLQSYRTIMAKREFVIPRFYEDEESDISLGYGINVGYQFSRNWSIESGLNYTSTALQFRARRQVRYTIIDEQPTGGGEFQSAYKLPFDTSNGTIESDVAVARSAGTPINENDFIALSLEGGQNFSYLNVPILARYHFGKGRWQVGLKGGVVNRILLDASFQFTSISTARQGLRVVVNDRFYQKRTLDKVNDYQVDFEIGAGLRFLATEQLWIYAEPTYRRSINPSHENMNFKTFPTVKAIEVGMGWRF